MYRRPTRHVHLRSHNFGQQNHTTTSLVRPCNNVPVIRSQKHWYEANGPVIQTWFLFTHVRVHIWTFVRTQEAHDNPPTESLGPASPTVRVIAFSHPLQHMMGVVVLETTMSVLYDLTPCDPKTFFFNSWPSYTLYDHTWCFPRTDLDISHNRGDMCARN